MVVSIALGQESFVVHVSTEEELTRPYTHTHTHVALYVSLGGFFQIFATY